MWHIETKDYIHLFTKRVETFRWPRLPVSKSKKQTKKQTLSTRWKGHHWEGARGIGHRLAVRKDSLEELGLRGDRS